MPYLSKAKLFRCSDRSISVKQITYIGLTLWWMYKTLVFGLLKPPSVLGWV